MEAKVYDASPAGVTDATTEAPRSLPSPLASPPFPPLGYTYIAAHGTRSRVLVCIPITPHAARRNNVTAGW